MLDAAVTDEAFAAALGKDTVKAVYAKDGLYAAGQRVDAGRVPSRRPSAGTAGTPALPER